MDCDTVVSWGVVFYLSLGKAALVKCVCVQWNTLVLDLADNSSKCTVSNDRFYCYH